MLHDYVAIKILKFSNAVTDMTFKGLRMALIAAENIKTCFIPYLPIV